MAKLTAEEAQRVIDYLNRRANGQIVCNICGNHTWSVNNTIFQLTEFRGTTITLGKDISILPVIPITCNNCGNTLFVNAIKVGIVANGVESISSQAENMDNNENE